MAKKRRRKKKLSFIRSLFRSIRTILLILLGLVILLTGLTFLSLKTSTPVADDLESIVMEEPMPLSQRFTFHPETETVDMRLDKNDFYRLLINSGLQNTLQEMRKYADQMGFSVYSYGLEFLDHEVVLNLDVQYNVFRFVLRVPLGIEFRKDGFIVTANGIKLGAFTLPDFVLNKVLGLKDGLVELRWEDGWYFLKDIQNVEYDNGIFTLTGSFDTDILQPLDNTFDLRMSRYSGDFSTTLKALRKRRAGEEKSMTEWFAILAENPERIADLVDDIFSISYKKNTAKDYKSIFASLGFGEILNADAYRSVNSQFYDQVDIREASMNELLNTLTEMYHERKIRFSNNEVVNHRYEPFDVNGLVEDTEWLTQNGFRLVLVDLPNASTTGCPKIGDVAGGNTSFSEKVSKKDTLALGFIVRGQDGYPILVYQVPSISYASKPITVTRVLDLSEEVYQYLYNSENVPVYSGD